MDKVSDVLFLCCAYSESNKELFREKSKRGYQFAAQNLQEALVEGFLQNNINLRVLSIPSLSVFPIGCKLPYVKDEPYIYKGIVYGASIGYINLPYIRGLHSIKRKVNKAAKEWYEKAGSQKVVFVYALLGLQMSLAVWLKEQYPDIKICAIVPDLPRFMGFNRFLKKLGFQKRYFQLVNSLIPSFDGFVVLADPMVDDLKIRKKPYVVVEGIYSSNVEEIIVEKPDEKVILYTGNIGKRYGIGLLIEAFELIKDSNYRLWIRGNGDNTEILSKAQMDSRIKYIGPLSKEDLVRLQKQATLLVNPVTPDQEFTRYFFPSKTMDYLASGTPTAMYKLDCLPQEYYNHLFFFSDLSASSMATTIEMICNKSRKELDSFGEDASCFIKEEKNARNQVAKIIELFDGLF